MIRLVPAREKWLPLIIGTCVVFASIWLVKQPSSTAASIFNRLDNVIYDLMLRATLSHKEKPASVDVVIVDIDERSLRAEGQWPWSRNKVASLVTRLAEYGAPLIAFDLIFAEPEENRLRQVVESIDDGDADKQALRTVLDRVSPYFEADNRFSEAIEYVGEEWGVDVILGYIFRDELPDTAVGALPQPIQFTPQINIESLLLEDKSSFTGNLPALQDASGYGGYFSVYPDEDGIYRRLPLIFKHDNNLYPSLALEVARVWLVAESIGLATEVNDDNKHALKHVSLASNYIVPTNERGEVLIPYRGPAFSFPYISATDVLNKRIKAEDLEGAIVLVGTSAAGLLDQRTTPVAKNYPGVEIHANMISSILASKQKVIAGPNGNKIENFKTPFPYGPDWAIKAEFWVTLVAGLLLALILPFCTPTMLVLVSVTFMGTLLFLTFACWDAYNVVIHLSMPFLTVFTVAGFNLSYNFLFERRRYRQLKGLFGQYIPPTLVERMSRDPSQLSMEGETRDMTVLFADIRSFTTISESLEATELKQMLNRFFTPMTQIIFNNRGTIDKYVGDMIMAFWGAPLKNEDHAEYAIRASLNMLDAVKALHAQFEADGLPKVEIGIGLNSGMMNVGDMGSVYRRSYTVIGDTVNLASRLEGLTKYYGVGLVVGENTREGQDKFVFRMLDKVKVKGKNVAVKVYEPVCTIEQATDELLTEIAQHEEALQLFWQKRWDDAVEIFNSLAKSYPKRLIYKVYLDRIEILRKRSLSDDWDGVYERREK